LDLNEPAVELFRDHKIDLAEDKVEIGVCAQHNNGGLRANLWWESNLRHLFPVGEVCGTHGVRRPGGAALNAGQVGSLRAALYIAENYNQPPLDPDTFEKVTASQVDDCVAYCMRVCDGSEIPQLTTPASVIGDIQERMSRVAAHVRDPELVDEALDAARQLRQHIKEDLRVSSAKSLPVAFRAADLCLTHVMFLEAIRAYFKAGGRSRGSMIVLDPSGELPAQTLDEQWRFRSNEPDVPVDREILEIRLDDEERVVSQWVPVRPVPDADDWFEVMWRDYRAGNVVG
jgi:succinate dehydrogenase/fumarate reductase flavoprotein subunit